MSENLVAKFEFAILNRNEQVLDNFTSEDLNRTLHRDPTVTNLVKNCSKRSAANCSKVDCRHRRCRIQFKRRCKTCMWTPNCI